MRRQGCALIIGMFLGSAAIAQPPADQERYPPPPELPGVVVGQVPSQRPVVSADTLSTRRTSMKPTEPAPLTDKSPPAPYPPEVTASIASPAEPVPMGKEATSCGSASVGCSKGCCGSVLDWLTFRSHARQSGCYIPPYRPPLQAWFPCDPHRGCNSCGAGARTCCNVPGAGPAGVPPMTGPLETIPPALGEPLTKTDIKGEAISGFRPIDKGLGFVPGAAPMACPTTQIERVSTWRPK